jgi:hypothetical protein
MLRHQGVKTVDREELVGALLAVLLVPRVVRRVDVLD